MFKKGKSNQFLVIGFSATETLPDPDKILLGGGVQNRFVRLDRAATLALPAVEAVIRAAIVKAKTPLPATGRGYMVIKSVRRNSARVVQRRTDAMAPDAARPVYPTWIRSSRTVVFWLVAVGIVVLGAASPSTRCETWRTRL